MSLPPRDLRRLLVGAVAARDRLDDGVRAAVAAYETGRYQEAEDLVTSAIQESADALNARTGAFQALPRAVRRARKGKGRKR
ncbi:MAG: Tar ligand binding domain-containing protein [Actinomycetota bacterium]|nr:Tar ligand binding domain-containing protein [Actinomycetota bacterium]